MVAHDTDRRAFLRAHRIDTLDEWADGIGRYPEDSGKTVKEEWELLAIKGDRYELVAAQRSRVPIGHRTAAESRAELVRRLGAEDRVLRDRFQSGPPPLAESGQRGHEHDPGVAILEVIQQFEDFVQLVGPRQFADG